VDGIHLFVESEVRLLGELEDEGSDGHAQALAPSNDRYWREASDQLGGSVEVEGDLLQGLAASGGKWVLVPRINPASREGHVAGPGIERMFGSLNEEQFGPFGLLP
jgi:hypothetical protein